MRNPIPAILATAFVFSAASAAWAQVPTACNGDTLTSAGTITVTGSLQTASGSVTGTTGTLYTFTTTFNTTYTFSLCSPFGSATYDSWLCLYDSTGTLIAENDDTCGLQSEIIGSLTPGTYYIAVSSFGTSAGSYTLGYFLTAPVPNDPTTLQQFKLDGSTSISDGGTTDENGVVLKGVVSDTGSLQCRLQVEVQPNGVAFTDTPTAEGGLVASGNTASVTVVGLALTSYRWQARTMNEMGGVSNWVQGGTSDPDFTVSNSNFPPSAPILLGQFESNGTTTIPLGGAVIGSSTVVLKASVGDPDNTVRLEVEVKAIGTPFDGVGTFLSPLVTSGSVASATVTGLTQGTKHWRARAIDALGAASGWESFGFNAESDIDFLIDPNVPTVTALDQLRPDGVTSIAVGGTTTDQTVLFRGTVADADGQTVRLEIEIALVGDAFTGTPTHQSAFVASGSVVTITASNVANGQYHWQARSVDDLDVPSAWTSFGGNGDPSGVDFVVQNDAPTLSLLSQHDTPATPAVGPGFADDEASLTFKALVNDAAGQTLQLEVEVQLVGTAFTDTATGSSASVASGNIAQLTLGVAAGAYHWQARVVDQYGATSPWSAFGGNAETATDFTAAAPAGFSTDFSSAAGWTLDPPTGSPATGWAVDATPAYSSGFNSSPSSLNYNNGTDFANGVTNSGNATSPDIDLGSGGTATLSFWCNYQTETTGGTFDLRTIQVSTDNFATTALNQNLMGTAAPPYQCAAMGTWHQHNIPLTGISGVVKIRFRFNTVDGVLNNFAGWFVDDLLVGGISPPTPSNPTTLAQFKADGSTAIATGATTDEPTVTFQGVVSDPGSLNCALQVEARPVGTAFTGTPNGTSTFAASGSTVQVPILGLANGPFHWQARTMNAQGGVSAWVSYPDGAPNLETDADFTTAYANTAPATPSQIAQFDATGYVGVPVGASINASAITARAVVTDANGNPVRLQIELQLVGTAFTDTPTATGPEVYSGGVAEVLSAAMPNGQYHWQVRAIDSNGATSAWVSFGGNAESATDVQLANNPPSIISVPTQRDTAAGVAQPVGFVDEDNTMVFRGFIDSNDPGQTVQLRIEVQPVGTAFTGTPTAVSAFVATGAAADVTIGSLANGPYHWQFWIADSGGSVAGPTSFGGNPETSPDFSIQVPAPPADPSALGQFESDGVTSVGTGATHAQATLIIKGTVSDPNSHATRLEVELQPVGVAFTNVPSTFGDYVASGSQSTVVMSPLGNGSYHWQARAVDASGSASNWVAFGGNLDPGDADVVINVATGTTYFTAFDTPAGWTFSAPSGTVRWNVDNNGAITGGPSYSGNTSLNYNNGTNFDNAGLTHSGFATSSAINITSLTSPVIAFRCNWSTETSTTVDVRRVRISNNGFLTTVMDTQVASGLTGAQQCGTSGTWHLHVFPLTAAWGTIQVRFFFDTVNGLVNTGLGWFVDDLYVGPAANVAPGAPVLTQFLNDGVTALPVGGISFTNAVLVKATMTDPENDAVMLEVEHRTIGTAFTNVPTVRSSFVPSGSVASVSLTALAVNGYHWQARAVDGRGNLGPWASFGANPETSNDFVVGGKAPNPPGADLNQYLTGGTIVVPVGGLAPTTVYKAIITDPDGEQVRLQIERRLVTQAFTGAFTTNGVLVNSGTEVSITVANAAGDYHWQARVVDATGVPSSWVPFPVTSPNPEADTDFYANTTPALPVATTLNQFQLDGSAAIAVGGNATQGGVRLVMPVIDPNNSLVKAQFEVRPTSAAFTGVLTAESPLVPSGTTVSVPIYGLPAGSYHWRARVMDANGLASGFSVFGGNTDVVPAAPDFAIVTAGTAATDPASLGQFLTNGQIIPLGNTIDETAVMFRATVADPSGAPCALQIEVVNSALLFNNSPMATSPFVASGSVAEVILPNLTNGVSYIWQARTVTAMGGASNWVVMGGIPDFTVQLGVNATPGVPTALSQHDTPSSTAAAVGFTDDDPSMTFRGVVSDPDGNQMLRLEIEARPTGAGFSQGTAISDWFENGQTATVTMTGLSTSTPYRWRARTIDSAGAMSNWVSFGANAETAADFIVVFPAAYQTFFNDATGWTLSASTFNNVGWAVDATPAMVSTSLSVRSDAASLNYNNGINFDTPGLPNSGTAISPVIDITTLTNPVLVFWCNYQTESTAATNDQRRVQFSNNGFSTMLLDQQVAGTLLGNAQCAAMGTWHTHAIPLTAAWGNIQVRFSFNTITNLTNTGAGWFIDDLSVHGSDTIAPAAVSDLAVSGQTSTTMTVQWTAPGDDGAIGTATAYDMRMRTSAIASDADFALSTPIAGVPAPGPAGTTQTFTITGLQPNTAYFFALKTADEVPNLSALSNGATGTTQTVDVTAPAGISDLAVTGTTATTATLTWTAPGDDGSTGTAAEFDIRWSLLPISSDADFNAANAVTGEPAPLVAGTSQSFTVTGLPDSSVIFFAIKTGDEVPNWSVLSNNPSASTTDIQPPAAVTDLTVSVTNAFSVTLQWTAPGDNGTIGTATTYDVRYSTTPIVTDADFNAATQATGEPVPGPASTSETFTVSGLTSQVTYYFAIKTADEVPNWSALSNVVSTTTLDGIAPAAIGNLAVTATTSTSITLQWTAPGDDVSTGTAAQYDLRVSTTTPLTTEALFAAATPVAGVPTPAVAGTVQSITITGLTPNTTYHFAIKTADEVPNWSTLSNALTTSTLANSAPAAPSLGPTATTGQFKTDGTTPITIGGLATATVVFRAGIADPDGDQVTLQVEVQPVGTAFTNTPTASGTPSSVPANVSVSVTLATDGQYHWQARTQDAFGAFSAWTPFGGNLETTADFNLDAGEPDSTITTAGPFNAATWGGTITGTATDTVTGIFQVRLRIQRTSDNQFWDGAGWTATQTDLVATGTTAWSFAFAPTNGESYNLTSIAEDGAGNIDSTPATSSFLYDTDEPDSTVTTTGLQSSSTWPGSIQGTATDTGGSGLQMVQITLRWVDTNQYWDGAAWVASPVFLLASGTTSWSFPFAPQGGQSYEVFSRATDAAGNVESTLGTNTFSFNVSGPDSTVTVAAAYGIASWPGSIQGSATTTGGATVTLVEITIQRASDSMFFNGTTYQAASVFLAAAGTTAWSYAFTPTSGETYTVQSRATDDFGNVESSFGTGTFIYDGALPTSTITTAGTFESGTFSGLLQGTSADTGGSGLMTVEVSILEFATGRYWDGTAYTSPTQIFVTATGTANWSHQIVVIEGGQYVVSARATDAAGNVESPGPVATITIRAPFGGSDNNAKCKLSAAARPASIWLMLPLLLAVLGLRRRR